ncbi:hypothetical protein ACE6H2_022857 [Prunus campanulata]
MYTQRISTSSPSTTPQWKYDVFLSFRGDDTRKGFTDHLYETLTAQGIITFRDEPKISKGRAISRELIAAIEGSRFALIVLSQNYSCKHGAWMNFYTFLNSCKQEKQCYQFSIMLIHLMYENKRGVLRKPLHNWKKDLVRMTKRRCKSGEMRWQKWQISLGGRLRTAQDIQA